MALPTSPAASHTLASPHQAGDRCLPAGTNAGIDVLQDRDADGLLRCFKRELDLPQKNHVCCGAAHPMKPIGEMKIHAAFQQVRRLMVVRSPGGAMLFGMVCYIP